MSESSLDKIIDKGIDSSLTPKQFDSIASFVKKYHTVDRVKGTHQLIKTFGGLRTQYNIKYIESNMDVDTQTIWQVTFIGVGIHIRFSLSNLEEVPDDCLLFSLYDWIMGFLKGTWIPAEEILRGKKIRQLRITRHTLK